MEAKNFNYVAYAKMEEVLEVIMVLVPSPCRVIFQDSYVYRYKEKNFHQVLIQKAARLISAFHANEMLLKNGFVQEQACIQRTIDEIIEDINFISAAIIFKDFTVHHERYIDYFFQEDFILATGAASPENRPTVPRKKVRSFIMRHMSGVSKNANMENDAAKIVSRVYSGYIHAASPQIMDMYNGHTKRFMTLGMAGTKRQKEHKADFWNCVYRGILAFAMIAKSFGEEDVFQSIRDFEKTFLEETANGFQSKEWPL